MAEIQEELHIEFPCGCMVTKMNGHADRITFQGLDLHNGQAATAAWLGNKPAGTMLMLELKLAPIPEPEPEE